MAKVIISKAGPLPIEVTIPDPGDAPVTFIIAGSCYTNTQTGKIGMNLEINGAAVAQSTIWANNLNEHLATVTTGYTTNLDPTQADQGTHKISLTNITGTVTDTNDWFTVIMNV